MLKLAVLAAAVAALLHVAKEERVLQGAGLLGRCAVVETAAVDGQWLACEDGRITEAPDLTRDACVRAGTRGRIDYWRCPAPLIASRSADGRSPSAAGARSP